MYGMSFQIRHWNTTIKNIRNVQFRGFLTLVWSKTSKNAYFFSYAYSSLSEIFLQYIVFKEIFLLLPMSYFGNAPGAGLVFAHYARFALMPKSCGYTALFCLFPARLCKWVKFSRRFTNAGSCIVGLRGSLARLYALRRSTRNPIRAYFVCC